MCRRSISFADDRRVVRFCLACCCSFFLFLLFSSPSWRVCFFSLRSFIIILYVSLLRARCFSFYALSTAFPSPYRIARATLSVLNCVASAFFVQRIFSRCVRTVRVPFAVWRAQRHFHMHASIYLVCIYCGQCEQFLFAPTKNRTFAHAEEHQQLDRLPFGIDQFLSFHSDFYQRFFRVHAIHLRLRFGGVQLLLLPLFIDWGSRNSRSHFLLLHFTARILNKIHSKAAAVQMDQLRLQMDSVPSRNSAKMHAHLQL